MRSWLAGLLVLLTCAHAQAEVVVMLSVKRDPHTSERHEWAVTHAITDFFAERDMPVVLPSQAVQRLGDSYVACDSLRCASGYIARLEADIAVGAVVFAEGTQVQAVNIALIRPDGLAFTGSVPVAEQGISVAARDAITLAWERYQRGPGPWLEVRGEAGHRLRVDSEIRGALPYRDRIEPGVHQLLVETPQGDPHYEASITVPDDPAQYTVVEASQANIEPEPMPVTATEPAAPPPPPRPRVSPYNYVAGGLLVAGGATILTGGALGLAKEGQCVDGGSPPCEAYKGGGPAIGMTVAGAVLTAAGAAWLAWRPLKTRPDLEVSLSGTMFHLRGAF